MFRSDTFDWPCTAVRPPPLPLLPTYRARCAVGTDSRYAWAPRTWIFSRAFCTDGVGGIAIDSCHCSRDVAAAVAAAAYLRRRPLACAEPPRDQQLPLTATLNQAVDEYRAMERALSTDSTMRTNIVTEMVSRSSSTTSTTTHSRCSVFDMPSVRLGDAIGVDSHWRCHHRRHYRRHSHNYFVTFEQDSFVDLLTETAKKGNENQNKNTVSRESLEFDEIFV